MKTIRHELRADGLFILTFDRPDSSANIFDRDTLLELDSYLRELGDARGLILTSSKPTIFIAGADLHGLQRMNAGELAGFIALGQSVFNRLAALKMPTVAAIHGACVGGGYELALACDWRVASPDRATKIGLPETKLGILPAWGGSTRLPRLIGVPAVAAGIIGNRGWIEVRRR
jgi:3-hydroxyacyl-CoA dehydrogenase/enoyl-CoA hydratase/3-hydroxybutyryl-CoA epimerase